MAEVSTPARSASKWTPLSALLALVLLGSILIACGLRTAALLQTLPHEAAGIRFDLVQVVDDTFRSGHPIDDVLALLGKERRNATAVFLDSSDGSGGVGAMSVDGVAGSDLLDAVVDAWDAPAVVRRSQRTIGDRDVWEFDTRSGYVTIVFLRGAVVYFSSSNDPDLAEAFVQEMP